MMTLTKREKVFISVLVMLVFCATLRLLAQHSVCFVYNHPLTNTDVFEEIAPPIKKMDFVLDKTKAYMGKDKYAIDYIYKNYYGSGFIQNNPIPNDLDSSIGVYLGEYTYDGTNSDIIANQVMSKISVFTTAFHEAVNNYSSAELIAARDTSDTFENIKLDEQDKFAFQKALALAFDSDEPAERERKSSPYILTLPKSAIDDASVVVNISYIMEPNEILIKDRKPVVMYSNLIKYNPKMLNYMREFTAIFDFFIDIKDKNTGKTKRMELIPEAFSGERLQYSRRMFVPNVFVGANALAYLNNFEFLTDDEKYLVNRLYNFERYIQVFEYNLDNNMLHVKMLKRLHQALDAFSPLLTKEERQDFYSVVNGHLNNQYIANLNDITNITTLLARITLNPNAFLYLKKNGHIAILSRCFDENLYDLKKSGKFDESVLAQIDTAEKLIVEKMESAKTENDYAEMVQFVQQNKAPIYESTAVLNSLLIDRNELVRIDTALKQKFIDVGYKRVKIYWIDEQNIAVLKSPILDNVKESDFRKQAVDSGLPDVNYKFVNNSNFDGKIYADSYVWVRLNPTEQQNVDFEKMKSILIQDRKNYSPKFKIILK